MPTPGRRTGIVHAAPEDTFACCGCSSDSSAARLAAGGSWRIRPRPGQPEKNRGCRSTVSVEAWSPETWRTDRSPIPGSQGLHCGQESRLTHNETQPDRRHGAAHTAAGMVIGDESTAMLTALGAQTALRSSGVQSATAMAAAEDAAAICVMGRGGRGSSRGDGRGGRGGRGGPVGRHGGPGGTQGKGGCEGQDGCGGIVPEGAPEAAAQRTQAEGEAGAAPEVAEEERWLREARRRADRAVAKAAAAAPSSAAAEAVRRTELARKAAVVRLQAAVRGAATRRQWRHVLTVLARHRSEAKAAVLAAEATARSEVEARSRAAEAAVLAAEAAAASRVGAERLAREAEWEEMATALIRQAVRHTSEMEARLVARRLVVVEASGEDADAATQTDSVEAAETGTQTAMFSLGRRVVAAAVQTESCGSDGPAESAREVVVGRQLHPAQAKAVERAERAAERVERLQAEAEAMAARYRVEGAAAQETAPTAPTATTPTSNEAPKGAVGSGGKQRKKAQLRRQAAAEGVDVRAWAASKAERRRQLLADAWEGMLAPGTEGLDQRVAWAHEDRMARRQATEEYWGEAAASRCFWEAARWRGEEGSRFSVLDAVE